MAERHLIALDLDGTLLKDDKTISLNTKEDNKKSKRSGTYRHDCNRKTVSFK